jgi:hypothetical protein
MKNPYFGFNFCFENFLGYTKNNPTKVTTTTVYTGGYEATDSSVLICTYHFNKYDFPTPLH